jgi:hypothetical protein
MPLKTFFPFGALCYEDAQHYFTLPLNEHRLLYGAAAVHLDDTLQ